MFILFLVVQWLVKRYPDASNSVMYNPFNRLVTLTLFEGLYIWML